MNKPIDKQHQQQQQQPRTEQPKPAAGLTLGPEEVEILKAIFLHSNPHPSVAYRNSLVSELVDKLRGALSAKHGVEFQVD